MIEHSEVGDSNLGDNKELQDALKQMGEDSTDLIFKDERVKNLKLSGILHDNGEVQGDTDDQGRKKKI